MRQTEREEHNAREQTTDEPDHTNPLKIISTMKRSRNNLLASTGQSAMTTRTPLAAARVLEPKPNAGEFEVAESGAERERPDFSEMRERPG